MDVELFARIENHLRQLAPHVASRETAVLLRAALVEIVRQQTRLGAMRQCFIDNTKRTTPAARELDIGRQIDDAVDRVVKRTLSVPNT